MKLFLSSVIFLVPFVSTWAAIEFEPIVGGRSGVGVTTRYWDCCKPSCAWKENIPAADKNPVITCQKNGDDILSDYSVKSSCQGGSAYTCNSQQPWAVSNNIAYGFAAASFTGGSDNSLCCACFKLDFTEHIVGKSFIVQITNTGDPLGENHFDLALPGGGVGIFPEGCVNQWNASSTGWGDQFGGIKSRDECLCLLPEALQKGCLFRFDFFNNADNPGVNFTQVKCPDELVKRSGCNFGA